MGCHVVEPRLERDALNGVEGGRGDATADPEGNEEPRAERAEVDAVDAQLGAAARTLLALGDPPDCRVAGGALRRNSLA